ncbi:FMN reductase [Pseudomonas aeruginosa]|uniref:FMN reductase n=1 Tax=Pseudomonas aeruginosa TaxID=287 RepID=UPI0029551E0F|nr:FMN reductase [Pseudomonas aeruginosa]MDV7847677.1 FMN reductase [Pseudomonas aeruginosa]
MTSPFKVVAVSGGTYRPSRTLVLTQALIAELGQSLPIDSRVIELTDIAAPLGATLARNQAPAELQAVLDEIESADLLLVYRGSYPGLLKHLFDLIDLNALIDTPVLLAATGGTERHALVLDHQLRPLFSFFQAITLPIGVYASEADFDNYRIVSEPLKARIRLAAERAAPLFGGRSELLKIA